MNLCRVDPTVESEPSVLLRSKTASYAREAEYEDEGWEAVLLTLRTVRQPERLSPCPS